MKKILFLLFTNLIVTTIIAQEFPWKMELKTELTDKNKIELKEKALRCVGINLEFNFNFNQSDLGLDQSDSKSDEPSSLEKAEQLIAALPKSNNLYQSYCDIANNYNRNGRVGTGNEYLQKAINLMDVEIQKEPNNPQNYNRKAALYLKIGNTQKMFENYQKSIEVNPKDTIALFAIAMFYMQTGNYDKSNEFFDKLMTYYPDYIGGLMMQTLMKSFQLYSQSFEQLKEKAYLQTLDQIFDLTKLKEASERNSDITYKLLYMLSRQYLFIMKSTFLERETDDDPFNLKFPENDYKEMKSLFDFYAKNVKRRDLPNTYIIHYALGALSLYQQNYQASISHYMNALKERNRYPVYFSNNSGKIYDNLIVVNLLLKDTLNAEQTLIKKIQSRADIDPNPDNYAIWGRLKLSKKEMEKAKLCFDTALNINPNHTPALRGYSIYQINNNQLSEAVTTLNKAMQINKYESDTHLLLGIAYLLQDSKAFAFSYLKSAYEIEPSNTELMEIMQQFFVEKTK